MKKIISLSIVAATAALISGYIAFQSQSQYVPRTALSGTAPGDMLWAMVDARTGEYNPNLRGEVLNQLQNISSRAGSLGLQFESLGPDNIGGRTRAIIEVYGKPDTMISGSTSGGLFISYNAGATWQPHAQFQNLDSSSSIIAAIHQDLVNGYIYVGTGSSFDAFSNAAQIRWPGYGIFVSKDDGITFQHLSATAPEVKLSKSGSPWLAVNRIKTDQNSNIYAATEIGFKKSSDLGATWEDVIFLDQANTFPSSAKFADVSVASSGRIIASTANGSVYMSESGDAGTFVQVNANGLPTSAARTCVEIAPSNEDHIYAMFIDGNACLDGIYETKNGGALWIKLLEPHDEFALFEPDRCQGVYDACLGVAPNDENTIYMGGLTFWRYDGNLTRVASEFGQPPFQDIFPNYLHADKHFVYFSPNDPDRFYVTTDGGISMSTNRGDSWQGLNKGYITTQFYGIAHTTEQNIVVGGTQDNGTLVVTGENEKDPFVGFQVYGNDGIDCDMSQISQITFASSQEGLVARIDAGQRTGTSFAAGLISEMGSGGPFNTVVKLWENAYDLTSKDSIEFEVKEEEVAIDVSNGIVRTYTTVVYPRQASAVIDLSSVTVYSSDQLLTVGSNLSTLSGDGTGTVSLNADGSLNVNVTFDVAPTENSNVYVTYKQSFEANSILVIQSNNLNSGLNPFEFEHRLESDLQIGDVLKIQDPVQSLLASTGEGSAGGLRMYRNVLNFSNTPPAIDIPGIGGGVTCVEFSRDGNYAFVGSQSGQLFRISGLQKLYSEDDISEISVSTISSGGMGFGGVTGIAIDPNDNNRLIVTGGGYGLADRVKISTNALTPTAASISFTNVHGNLPTMPIYDAEIDRNDPGTVLLGTEFGIWATSNVNEGASTTWSDENSSVTYVPVYDIKQQYLPWERAKNSGVYYIGTHGRGLWRSTSLVGIKNLDPAPSNKEAFSGLKVYPNPMQSAGFIEFESSVNVAADVRVYDINGRMVKSFNERVVRGSNQIAINVGELRPGNYFATIQSGSSKSVAKFIVLD